MRYENEAKYCKHSLIKNGQYKNRFQVPALYVALMCKSQIQHQSCLHQCICVCILSVFVRTVLACPMRMLKIRMTGDWESEGSQQTLRM